MSASIFLNTGLISADDVHPVEYHVVFPDHDWVVAARQKLIPSFIQKDGLEQGSQTQSALRAA